MAGFYGCERQGGADGGIINPIMSSRLRTAKYFTFMYGKVEVRAKVHKVHMNSSKFSNSKSN